MSTSWRVERASFGREAADHERQSRERSTCLTWRVCICISRQKWEVAWLAFGVSGFICESLTSIAECVDSTPSKSIERVCVSPSSKEQICLLCAKADDFRRPEKYKNLFQSCSQYWERRFHSQGILDIRTHFKPTETFQYTHFSSCNPHGVRKGLIKGEAPRLLRTNSSAKSFYKNIYKFKNAFVLEVILTISWKKSPLRLNLRNTSQVYKRKMKCERKFCLPLRLTTLLCRTHYNFTPI